MGINLDESAHEFRWNPFLRQLFASSIAWMTFFMFGLSLGTPTVTIPQLRKEANSTASVSDEMASLISAVVGYVGMIWVPGLTIISHYFGRKVPFMFVTINACAAFIVLYCSRSATHVLVAQILHGMTAASQTTICFMLVSEYTTPRYRGVFLTIKSATVFWGVWVANAIGAFYDFRNIGIVGIVTCFYTLVALFCIPESPYWLSNQLRYDECATSHRWLKGVDTSAEKELEVLLSTSDGLIIIGKKKTKSFRQRFNVTVENMSRPEIYKPLGIILVIMSMYHGSGKFVCTMYSLEIIKKITDSESTAYAGMLILDGVTVVAMYVGCGFSKIIKRRSLLLTCATIGTSFLYILSIYLYLIKLSLITENSYVSIGLLAGFSIAICCGPTILSGTIVPEVVPLKARGLCICLSSLFSKFLMGTILHISPFIFKSFGFHGTFLTFGLISTVCITLVYKYVPETKDKTLHEISNLFKARNTVETELLNLNKNNSYIEITENQ